MSCCGKLVSDQGPIPFGSRTALRPVTVKIAVLANQLPADNSGDPCDRLMGATALAEGLALVTRDTKIRAGKQIETIW